MVTADDPGDWVGWLHQEFNCAEDGLTSWVSEQISGGSTEPIPAPFYLSVASDGTVTGGLPGHKVMSLDKNLIVLVGDGEQEGGGLWLGLMLRN